MANASNRSARVGELIRRVIAEGLDELNDERLDMVSITGVEVDRELSRAIVWFTTLNDDDDPEIEVAFAQHAGRLRHAVSTQTRLRRAPFLQFRVDTTLRSAQRIEELLRNDTRDDGEPDD